MENGKEFEFKTQGKCPWCEEVVRPLIIEENILRRDKCQCPNPDCQKAIYVCRTFGCSNFAVGSKHYDSELCPECVNKLKSEAGDILRVIKDNALPIIAVAAAGVICNAIKGDEDK